MKRSNLSSILKSASRLFAPTLAIMLGFAAWANPARAGEIAKEKLAAIKPAMQAFVDQGEIAGAVTVVGRDDGIVSMEAVGKRDHEKNVPMTADSLFRIASMTKPITALAIMILADEGKLDVTDPVQKHLPEFRGQMLIANRSGDSVTLRKPPRPITIHDLLTHTSGLPGGMPEGLSDLYTRRHLTLAEAVLVSSQRPLDFEPGSRWSYCNAGIDALGRIVEVRSGMKFEDFLRARIFEPLGMKDTTFYPTPKQLARAAVTYAKRDGKLVADNQTIIGPPNGAKHPIPAGGLYSTGGDLARFYRMMLGGGQLDGTRLLSKKGASQMTSLRSGDITTGFVPGMGWGYGFAVVRQPTGVTEMLSEGTYGHGGAFGTQGWIDPQRDVFYILLIQRTGMPNSDGSPIRLEFQRVAAASMKS